MNTFSENSTIFKLTLSSMNSFIIDPNTEEKENIQLEKEETFLLYNPHLF
jgi:hypothetical protein